MEKYASAQWRGNLKQGMGFITSGSGILTNVPYSFLKRFGHEPGTNPEELIGSALSACYAMAVSGELEKRNLNAELIDVHAQVFLEQSKGGWSVPKINLNVSADVPNTRYEEVQEAAKIAKENCHIAKLL